jgi:hypothetical protein
MGQNLMRVGCALALACLAALGGCGSDHGSGPQAPADPGPDPTAGPVLPDAVAAGLVVAFMLDPTITTSVYMGERWVTPPTFTLVDDGDVVSVHARAQVGDRSGRRDVSARWTPADREMLTVPPDEAHQVEIIVRRAGQTTLTVTAGELTTSLAVVAVEDGGSWRVDISQ